MTRCWFCLKPLTCRAEIERHHLLCQRYLTKEELKNRANVVFVHSGCHARHHRTHDNPCLSRENFIAYMTALNWCEGIFSGE